MPVRHCCGRARYNAGLGGVGRVNNAGLNIELATLDPTGKQTIQIYLYQPYAFWPAAVSEPSRGFVQTTAVFEFSICVSATVGGGGSVSTLKALVTCISNLRRLVPVFSSHFYSSMSACSWVIPCITGARYAWWVREAQNEGGNRTNMFTCL